MRLLVADRFSAAEPPLELYSASCAVARENSLKSPRSFIFLTGRSMVEDLEVRRGLRAPVCGRFSETVQGRVWIHVSLPDVHRQFLMAGRFDVFPVRRGAGMPGPYSGVVGLVSEPRWNVQVRIALGGGVRRRGRMRITTWLLSLLLSCVLVSGPRNGTRARPARPAMVCAS